MIQDQKCSKANTLILKDEQATQKLAWQLAAKLEGKETILLHGPLGAGKTAFTRALIRALCDDANMAVPSPTYTLIQPYETPGGLTIWHCDLYRIHEPEELDELGLPDMLGTGLVLIEWPDRLGVYKPAAPLEVRLDPIDNHACQRQVTLTNAPEGVTPA
mgnify:CR=1 FL=1